jgi:cobalamin synthase
MARKTRRSLPPRHYESTTLYPLSCFFPRVPTKAEARRRLRRKILLAIAVAVVVPLYLHLLFSLLNLVDPFLSSSAVQSIQFVAADLFATWREY